ncbi:SDR family oxidoreductase [Caldicellulosiruptoraceae bacterium PP1]
MSEFADKIVVVTGGAQGIGYAISESFLKEKALVLIIDNDIEAIDEIKNNQFKEYKNIDYFICDLSQPEQIKMTCNEITKRYNKVDILINNAGVGNTKSIIDRTVEEWDYVINVNLRAPYLMVKYLIDSMPQYSSIINIASTRAFMSEKDTEPYSASKGGIIALTHSLAVSLSYRKIRVNSISPGWIDVSGYKKSSQRKPEILREIDHLQHPVGRVGMPQDIANACLFLCSEKAGFITGTNLTVDGGMTIKMIYEE